MIEQPFQPPKNGLTAAILAGGQSRRFGSDKALAKTPGTDLMFLEQITAVCRSVTGEVIIVAPPRAAYSEFDARLETDRFPGEGPAGGIITALMAATTEYLLLLSCDQPMVSRVDLAVLAGACTDHPAVAFARDSDSFHPLPCALNVAACLAPARAAFMAGTRSIIAILQSIGVTSIQRPDVPGNLDRLFDVDTPEDLDRLRDEFGELGPPRC